MEKWVKEQYRDELNERKWRAHDKQWLYIEV